MAKLPRGRAHDLTAAPRHAVFGDVAALTDLWASALAHHASLDALFALRPGAAPKLSALLKEALRDPDQAVLVADGADALIGFCAARIERAPLLLVESGRAQITEVFVEPTTRRGGTGRTLVEAALAWIAEQGVARVEVRVVVGNREGQGFWRALGFGDFVDVLHRRL